MSADAKSVSEREAVLRERKAFTNGMVRMHGEYCTRPMALPYSLAQIEDIAKKAFALPTVTRPRVVADPHGGPAVRWSTTEMYGRVRVTYADDGDFEVYPAKDHGAYPTPERVALWADLLARPTEEIAE